MHLKFYLISLLYLIKASDTIIDLDKKISEKITVISQYERFDSVWSIIKHNLKKKTSTFILMVVLLTFIGIKRIITEEAKEFYNIFLIYVLIALAINLCSFLWDIIRMLPQLDHITEELQKLNNQNDLINKDYFNYSSIDLFIVR